MAQLISLIEINIGRDLQYIRFNGSLIGGLAGLALYTARIPASAAVTYCVTHAGIYVRGLLSPGLHPLECREPAA